MIHAMSAACIIPYATCIVRVYFPFFRVLSRIQYFTVNSGSQVRTEISILGFKIADGVQNKLSSFMKQIGNVRKRSQNLIGTVKT